RRVGFPYGAFGPGYLLPDSAPEERMQRVLSLLQVGGFTAVWTGYGLLRIVFGAPEMWGAKPWSVALAVSVVYFILYHVAVKGVAGGLTKTTVRLRYSDIAQNQSQSVSRVLLMPFIVLSALIVGGSVWLILVGQMMLGTVCLVFFGAVMLHAGYIL